jgi:CheY-like chemotaxis protein
VDDYKKYSILIVDDDELLRKTIVFDFKRRGFNILEAGNGTEAIGIVKSTRIDLVISDIRMPGGDGITLLEEIRAYDPRIPSVILITGFADITERECIEKGATQVVSKPFDRKALLSAVLAALGLSGQGAPGAIGA